MGPSYYEIELIGSGFLAVMAKPVAGEWIDDEFSGLYEAGLRQVVSLLESHEAYELGLSDEQSLCVKHGLRFVSYPIPDRGLPPTVEGFRELTKTIYHESAGGVSTVIHCRAGIGRTGLVAAGVLLHAAFGVEEAFDQISSRRGVEVPDTQEQRDWLRGNFNEIVKRADPCDGSTNGW
ncbi:MAG: protein-tyrosine phosphatase family protein [Pseudomonadota bacterium]